jgi:N-acetylglutamate synthase-like GNAT family acetyltransferase
MRYPLLGLPQAFTFDTILRRAQPSDVGQIRDVTRRSYAKWIALIGREPKPMAADYSKAVAQHWIDVVEQHGQVIALIEMIPHESHLFIENLAVDEAFQHKGIGRKLLAHAEQLAVQAQLVEVQLATNAAFVENLHFYKRCGYEDYLTKPLFDGGTMTCFRKSVS